MRNMSFRAALAVGLAAALQCAGSTKIVVNKEDVTATQAIVHVTTDQTGFCAYRVSEGPSFAAMVNDVNSSLFPGANMDSRPGSLLTGIEGSRFTNFVGGSLHVFVAGTRTVALGLDGNRYSRALQANTLHWVGATCGSDAEVSTSFTTLDPPLGDDEPEQMPFDPGAFGNVAVPKINWSNRPSVYNDPITGVQLERMTDAADFGFVQAAQTFNYAVGGAGWQNPSNALSAGSSSLATCNPSAGCAAGTPLALVVVIPTSILYQQTGAWDPHLAYADFLVRMWGSGTDPSAANRTVAVCWSVNNQSCFTSSQNIVLPQSTPAFAGTAPQSWSLQSPWSGVGSTALTNIVVSGGAATVNFSASPGLSVGQQICVNGITSISVPTAQGGNGLNGCHTITAASGNSVSFATNAVAGTYTDTELLASTGFPVAQWASWGTPPLHSQVGQRAGGTMGCVSGSCTLSSSGSASSLDTSWTSGTLIYIAGSSPTCPQNLCTIASMTDALHLTLSQSLTISGASWTSANFSLIVEKTTSTGAVSVSAAYDLAWSATYNGGLDGSGDIGNTNLVTVSVDANGNPISPSLQGYLTVATSASNSSWTPIYLFIPSTGETRLIARNWWPTGSGYRAWTGWHPTQGNCWFLNQPFGTATILQACYTGDYRALTPGYPQSYNEADTPEQLTFTDLFATNSITSQIANCAANHVCPSGGINPAVFNVPPVVPGTGAAIKGNYLLMCGVAIGVGQDGPGYYTLWNIGGSSATLAWANYTFASFPTGYGGIHSCLSFGNGQYNTATLNGSGGQVSGSAFTGPWQQTPTMYNSGSGLMGNTTVAQTDGFSCPSGLPTWIQDLGAVPVGTSAPNGAPGVARCLEFVVPGDFCSIHASTAEAAAYPCPWNSSYSLIKPIGVGDELVDSHYGADSYGERMLVVKVTPNSPSSGNIDLIVFRYGQQSQTPYSGFTCGTYNSSEWNHANGWTMYAQPYHACFGSVYWVNAADSTFSYTAENPAIIGAHSDFGQGSNGYTYVEGAGGTCSLSGGPSCYIVRADEPMPTQIGGAITNNPDGDPMFSSTQLPDIYLQSYPSKRQQSGLTPPTEMDWALDVRHYNPSQGNGAETPEGLFGNTVALVSGHTQTYLITFAGSQMPDPKIAGFVGWSGYHMLYDASGPNSSATFGDSTSWAYCYAYNSGECVSGSSAGSMYVSVPHDLTANPCIVNTYAYDAPCIANNYPIGFWVDQFSTNVTDATGIAVRRLTSALVAPGRQYNFTNAKATPDGRWAQVMAPWLEGQRTDMLWAKLPPWPGPASTPGTSPTATQVTVQLTGVAGDNIRVAFGYAENGDPANFYCTSRAEACYTTASPAAQSPFVYAGEAQAYTPCTGQCTVQIPALPGRVLYYQVQRQNGSTSVSSGISVVAVP